MAKKLTVAQKATRIRALRYKNYMRKRLSIGRKYDPKIKAAKKQRDKYGKKALDLERERNKKIMALKR